MVFLFHFYQTLERLWNICFFTVLALLHRGNLGGDWYNVGHVAPMISCLFSSSNGTGVVISKTEGQTFRYRFGNETKTCSYRFQISLVENRLFQFYRGSALPGKIERIIYDKTKWGKNSLVFLFHFYQTSECLWNICETFAPLLF